MSQKSSVPQAVSFVSQVLKRDNELYNAHYHIDHFNVRKLADDDAREA